MPATMMQPPSQSKLCYNFHQIVQDSFYLREVTQSDQGNNQNQISTLVTLCCLTQVDIILYYLMEVITEF